MSKDLLPCQVAARNVALVYTWWKLFVACADPVRGREAIQGRPLFSSSVARMSQSRRQLRLALTSTYGEAARALELLTNLSLFLSGLKNTAEQLGPAGCWERIWARILQPYLRPRAWIPARSGWSDHFSPQPRPRTARPPNQPPHITPATGSAGINCRI
jgi:hypothetical protein